ncbi:hypothetical protein V6S67_19305 [Arthrobacter sp. Soc17.1.1.1]|uniref:hypothetical protein n=1 Tax=Arthrobacter sp. Soc17.1.1.1 TaxID=3121277 RepID=UPI002FE4C282
MGNGVDGVRDGSHQIGRVQIVDLGADSPEERSLDSDSRPAPSKRRRFVVGGLVGAGLVGGLALLPPINDIPPPQEISPPIEALSACQAVKQAEQDEAAMLIGEDGGGPARNLPSGYSLFGVMASPNTTSLIGILHPDGSVEICEESARRASFTVRFTPQADLGELPEGMTYAYDQARGLTDNTLTLGVKGVRLGDGTVVRSLTLSDGRTVPAAPGSEQQANT